MLELLIGGSFDVHFSRFNEDISIAKPKLLIKNIIFGRQYCDFGNTVVSKNHKTGEEVEVTLIEAKGD